MKKLKLMYRTETILARNISTEGPRRKSLPELPQVIVTLHGLPLLDSIHRLTRGSLAVDLLRFSVINTLFPFQNSMAPLAVENPFWTADHGIATWFHQRLTPTFVTVLHAFTEFDSGEWIGVILFALVLFFAWKRWWPSLVTLIIAVPVGMLLNEWLKLLVHRHRPFVEGPLWIGLVTVLPVAIQWVPLCFTDNFFFFCCRCSRGAMCESFVFSALYRWLYS
jgi:hypothetical protein